MLSRVRDILEFHRPIFLISIKKISVLFIIKKMQKSLSLWNDNLLFGYILQESDNNTKVIERYDK